MYEDRPTNNSCQNMGNQKKFSEIRQQFELRSKNGAHSIEPKPLPTESRIVPPPPVPPPPATRPPATPPPTPPRPIKCPKPKPIPQKHFSKSTDNLAAIFEDCDSDCDLSEDEFGLHLSSWDHTMLRDPRQRRSLALPQTRPKAIFGRSASTMSRMKPHGNAQVNAKAYQTLNELIETEQNYVETLWRWIGAYESHQIFQTYLDHQRIWWNIKQIAQFHRDTLLPMFHRCKHSISALCGEFSAYIDRNCFYPYVYYTMHRGESLCELRKNAECLKEIANHLGDKLGIYGSLLLQPNQRLPKYSLLFEKILKESFSASHQQDARDCTKLLDKLEKLIQTVNDARDIEGMKNSPFRLDDQKLIFRKTLQLNIIEQDSDNSNKHYNAKIFIFDSFIMYAEDKYSELLYRGHYDASKGVDLIFMDSWFLMAHRREQVCRFFAEKTTNLETCFNHIDQMLNDYEKNYKSRQRMAIDSGIEEIIYDLPS